jgi:FkbM family methyltransferase
LYRVRDLLNLNAQYEKRFNKALENTIRPGDVVWDVGANVGFYTELFSRWVGPNGQVVAFEPNPKPLAEAEQRVRDCSWVSLENVALGARNETLMLVVQKDYSKSGHVSSDADECREGEYGFPIQVNTGDTVCKRIGRVPNVIKIDVEGFEEEVLQGLRDSLSSPELRAILIEVHFQQLKERGEPMAPVRMEKFLKDRGFKIEWADLGHMTAFRA